jgi:alkylated DNA repair protein alkB family protein 1
LRKYVQDLKSSFPTDLSRLCRQLAHVVGTDLEPETAIVNFYSVGNHMGGHLDDAEHAMDKPIISLSLGCSAIFLIGGKVKSIKPTPILVRSGDVIIMSGASRSCYHGIPLILPFDFATNDPHYNPDRMHAPFDESHEPGDDALRHVRNFLRRGRINVNARQVMGTDESEWIDKHGTLTIKPAVP